MNSPETKRNKIIGWIIAHQNASIVIFFTLFGIIALMAPGGGGGSGGNGDSDEEGKGKGDGSGRYPDSVRYYFDSVQVQKFDNGDTNWVSYFNADRKRIKYVEKYENGVTRCIWTSHYTNDRQIDSNINYFNDGKESGRIRKVNDLLDGEQIVYYEGGIIKLKRNYEMGTEKGLSSFYDSTGTLKKTEMK